MLQHQHHIFDSAIDLCSIYRPAVMANAKKNLTLGKLLFTFVPETAKR